jgi:hypothetical protein
LRAIRDKRKRKKRKKREKERKKRKKKKEEERNTVAANTSTKQNNKCINRTNEQYMDGSRKLKGKKEKKCNKKYQSTSIQPSKEMIQPIQNKKLESKSRV